MTPLAGSSELQPQLSSGPLVSISDPTSVRYMRTDLTSLFQFNFTAFLGRTTHLDLLNDI